MDACFEKPFRSEIMQQITARWLPNPTRARGPRNHPPALLNASADRPPRPGASRQGLCENDPG
jgi:hypothetical protein